MNIQSRRRPARLVALCLGSAAVALVPSVAFGADVAGGTIRAAIGGDGSVQSVKQISASGTSSAFSGKLPLTMTISHTTAGSQTTYTYHVENTTSQMQTIHYTDTAGNERHTSATLQLPLVAQLGVDVPTSMTNLTAANAAVTTSADGPRHVLWQMVLFAPLGSPTQDVSFTVDGSGTPVAELRATTVDPSTAAGLSAAAQDAQASYQQDDFWNGYAAGGVDGLNKLAAGATQLYQGLNQGLAGTREAASGSTQLYDGAQQLHSGLVTAGSGFNQAADGSVKLYKGSKELTNGLDQLADKKTGLPFAVAGLKQLHSGLGELLNPLRGDNTDALHPGFYTDSNGKKQFSILLAYFADASQIPPIGGIKNAIALSVSTQQSALNAINNLLSNDSAFVSYLGTDPAAAATIQGLVTALSTTAAKPGVLPPPLDGGGIDVQLQANLAPLFDGLQLLVRHLDRGTGSKPDPTGVVDPTGIYGGLGQVVAPGALPKAASGAEQAAAGSKKITSGLQQLSSGLVAGAKQFPQAVSGSAQIADGLQQLSSGLVSGAKTFPEAVSGAQQVADGVKQVNSQAVGPLHTQLTTASLNEHQKIAVLDSAAALASSAPGGAGTSYVLTQNSKDFALAAASSPSHTARNVGIGLGGVAVLLVGLLGGFALGRQRRVVTTA
jgi:putative membrane protein